MNKTITLDETDERIIAAFQKNGRASNRAVGRELNLSEGLIRKRMKRMIDAGAVSYGLVVDVKATEMGALGWLNVRATAASASAVADAISKLKLCSLSLVTTGEWNIRAYIYAEDLTAMAATTEAISQLDGVLGVAFRQSVTHTRHRYEYVISSDAARATQWNSGE